MAPPITEKCAKCGGTGVRKVPKKRIKAVVTEDGNRHFTRTLNYVPKEVYGVTDCTECGGKGGTTAPRGPRDKHQSEFLPGIKSGDFRKVR